MDDVVAVAAMNGVVAAHVGDDVIAVAPDHEVVAVATFEAVIGTVAIERVVAVAGNENVIDGRATEHHMVFAGVLQVVGIRADRRRVVPNDQRREEDAADRIGITGQVVDGAHDAVRTGNHTLVELPGRVDLQGKGRSQEHDSWEVGRIGVGHHQSRERVVLQLGDEVQPRVAFQVVEAVGVLQLLHLGLEHEVEGRAEHAAKRHFFLGEAADPEVDVVQTGNGDAGRATRPGAGAIEEVQPVRRLADAAQHQERGRGALPVERRGAGNGGVRAVGGDEVDQRFRVLQVLHQIGPAGVGLQLAVAGAGIEFTARRVQGRDAGIAAARDVEGGQVERQAQQVVAHRFGDELIDLVADLARQAADDGTGRLFRGRAAGRKRQRIEEGLNQADLARGEVGVQPVNGLGQHRVAEAVDRVRELGDDRRVDLGLIILVFAKEGIDVRLNGTRELFEHQVLVLHLGTESRRLEQALSVPVQGSDLSRGCWQHQQLGIRHQPLVQEVDIVGGDGHILGVLDQTVVLRVENRVDGGQADVLVDPTVAGDVVRVEQLVVVGACGHRAAGNEVGIGRQWRTGLAVHRNGAVGDIDEELVAGAHGIDQADRRSRITLDENIIGGISNTIRAPHHDHREAVRSLDEIAVGVGGEQRHVVEVGIGKINAKQIARLRLHHFPGGHPTDFDVVRSAEQAIGAQVTIGDQPAGRHRIAGGIELVGAQEHLVRRVRGIGLVLVDERRGGV
ncbi:hypothetical protein D3C85_524870 [compost metagenome]